MERLEDLMVKGLKIYQDDDLYCFTSDSILLTKFVSVKKNDLVADFCSGCGIVGLHLYALNPTIKKVYLFLLQEELSSLSKKSVELNGLTDIFEVQNIPIQKIGNEFNNYFSLITVNPPFFKKDTQKALDIKIAMCREELTVNLEEIISIASKKLKFGGRFNMVNKADRLAEIFYLMKSYKLEPKKLQFVKNGDKEPYLVMVEGVKGGKEGLKILKTLEN